jgi:hypothetical protein
MSAVDVARDRITPTDSSRLIGLTSDGARIILVLFIVSNFIFMIATIDEMKNWVPPVLAVIIVNAAAILLVLDHPDPFPSLWSWGVVIAVGLSTVLVAFQLPDVAQVGRASWHLGANTWLLFFLALRRRAGMAWFGYGLMALGTLSWTISADRSIMSGLYLLDTHAAILFVATLFGVFLRRTARYINEYDERAISGAMESAAASAAVEIRHQRVLELQASAGPLLERIARGSRMPTAEERREYRAAEALLRDGVRGRSLVSEPIVSAATSARDRGIEVVLLDDRGEPLAQPEAMLRVADFAVGALNAAHDGSVTVRLHPRGRDVTVSIVSTSTAGSVRLDLDGEGMPIPRGHEGIGGV